MNSLINKIMLRANKDYLKWTEEEQEKFRINFLNYHSDEFKRHYSIFENEILKFDSDKLTFPSVENLTQLDLVDHYKSLFFGLGEYKFYSNDFFKNKTLLDYNSFYDFIMDINQTGLKEEEKNYSECQSEMILHKINLMKNNHDNFYSYNFSFCSFIAQNENLIYLEVETLADFISTLFMEYYNNIINQASRNKELSIDNKEKFCYLYCQELKHQFIRKEKEFLNSFNVPLLLKNTYYSDSFLLPNETVAKKVTPLNIGKYYSESKYLDMDRLIEFLAPYFEQIESYIYN